MFFRWWFKFVMNVEWKHFMIQSQGSSSESRGHDLSKVIYAISYDKKNINMLMSVSKEPNSSQNFYKSWDKEIA